MDVKQKEFKFKDSKTSILFDIGNIKEENDELKNIINNKETEIENLKKEIEKKK